MKVKDKTLEATESKVSIDDKTELPEKKQLSGFNLDEYVAKPMELNITPFVIG